MKAARILVLAVALATGGAAAFLIGSDEEKKPEASAATLEIAPRQAETLMLARQLGTLSLSLPLHSLLDASKVSEDDDRKPDINTVRFGVSTK